MFKYCRVMLSGVVGQFETTDRRHVGKGVNNMKVLAHNLLAGVCACLSGKAMWSS